MGRVTRTCKLAVGLSGVAAIILLVVPWLPWAELPHGGIEIIGADPTGTGTGQVVRHVHRSVPGIVGGPGQLVFAAGISLAVLLVVLVAWPRARRRGWLTVVPGLVAAGAVGYWHRGVQPAISPFGRGWSLVPLLAAGLLAVVAGLWAERPSARGAVAAAGAGLAAGTLACGIAAVTGTAGSEIPLVLNHIIGGASDGGYFS